VNKLAIMDRVILLGNILNEFGPIKGEKSLQKIIYLFQQYCHHLGYRYNWNIHGPISNDLITDIHESHAIGITSIKWEDNIPIYQSNSNLSHISKYWKEKLERDQLSNQVKIKISKIRDILQEKMENPEELEILSSIHYINNSFQHEINHNNNIHDRYSPDKINEMSSILGKFNEIQ